MALVATPAVVLQTFRYGETSKIVRLATREYGLQSAIAKGASRPKSRFGANLQALAQGIAQLYLKPASELHTLAAFDLTEQRSELGGDLARYAAAMALAELMLRCAPAEPQAALFDRFVDRLERLARVPPPQVGPAGIAALWSLVGALGFAPTLGACARDGSPLEPGPAGFSVPEGGLLCSRCSREGSTTRLSAADRMALQRLASGADEIPAGWSARHAAAHRRLVARFVRHHLAEGRTFKALEFWERSPWTGTS